MIPQHVDRDFQVEIANVAMRLTEDIEAMDNYSEGLFTQEYGKEKMRDTNQTGWRGVWEVMRLSEVTASSWGRPLKYHV